MKRERASQDVGAVEGRRGREKSPLVRNAKEPPEAGGPQVLPWGVWGRLARGIQTSTLGENGLRVCGHPPPPDPHAHTDWGRGRVQVRISAGLRRWEEVTAWRQRAGEKAGVWPSSLKQHKSQGFCLSADRELVQGAGTLLTLGLQVTWDALLSSSHSGAGLPSWGGHTGYTAKSTRKRQALERLTHHSATGQIRAEGGAAGTATDWNIADSCPPCGAYILLGELRGRRWENLFSLRGKQGDTEGKRRKWQWWEEELRIPHPPSTRRLWSESPGSEIMPGACDTRWGVFRFQGTGRGRLQSECHDSLHHPHGLSPQTGPRTLWRVHVLGEEDGAGRALC